MDEETETPSEPAKAKPSQVPSWVTLGFVLGALFVMALPKREAEEARPRPPVGEAAAAKPAKPAAAPRITTIEAVFSDWDRYAVWSGTTTEVALWSTDTMSYSDCYEVLKTA